MLSLESCVSSLLPADSVRWGDLVVVFMFVSVRGTSCDRTGQWEHNILALGNSLSQHLQPTASQVFT